MADVNYIQSEVGTSAVGLMFTHFFEEFIAFRLLILTILLSIMTHSVWAEGLVERRKQQDDKEISYFV